MEVARSLPSRKAAMAAVMWQGLSRLRGRWRQYVMSWFTRAFGYGLGVSVGRALFGDGRDGERRPEPREPIRQQTEAEIQAAEKRYDAEAKALEEADARSRA